MRKSGMVFLLACLVAAPGLAGSKDATIEKYKRQFSPVRARFEREMQDVAKQMLADYEQVRLAAMQKKDQAAANAADDAIRELRQRKGPLTWGEDLVMMRHLPELEKLRSAFSAQVSATLELMRAEYGKEKDRAISLRDLDKANALSAAQARLTSDRALQEYVFGDVPGARVRVTCNVPAQVGVLKAGAGRLSNMGDARIESTRLRDAVFTVVPWQSQPSCSITVKEAGILYVLCVGSQGGSLAAESDKWPRAEGVVTGGWIPPLFARYVREGESFVVSGFECSILANAIELAK